MKKVKSKEKSINKSKGKSDKAQAETVLKALKKEIKAMKLEAKALQNAIEDEQKALATKKAEIEKQQQSSQKKNLRGHELVKLSQLRQLGYKDEVIMKHLQQENQVLSRLFKEKQQDRKNLAANIQKMKDMNQQSERAISVAEIQLKKVLEENTKEKALLDEAELKLYAAENKVKHRRGMNKTVAITNKEPLRNSIKDIVNEVKTRCKDKEVVKMVLKVAGKCLAYDMDTSGVGLKGDDGNESDSSISVEISSCSSADDD